MKTKWVSFNLFKPLTETWRQLRLGAGSIAEGKRVLSALRAADQAEDERRSALVQALQACENDAECFAMLAQYQGWDAARIERLARAHGRMQGALQVLALAVFLLGLATIAQGALPLGLLLDVAAIFFCVLVATQAHARMIFETRRLTSFRAFFSSSDFVRRVLCCWARAPQSVEKS